MLIPWLQRASRKLSGAWKRLSRHVVSGKAPGDWAGLSAREAFSHIYARRLWGGGPEFYSGSGSHEPRIVTPHVAAVREWMAGQGPLDAVDLGCGDFHVGAALRPLFRNYVACDVVPALIEHHRRGPHAGTVDFRCLDLASDPLPAGDVVLLRQVLQHLPNAMIQALVPKLAAYRWLVLTEHLPHTKGFAPNLDKPIGPDTRLGLGSGIDLCAPPFSLVPRASRILCEAPQFGGRIRTTLYRLQ